MGYTHACYGDVEQLHEQGGTAETYDARFAQREATVGEANNDILRELVEQRSYDGLQDVEVCSADEFGIGRKRRRHCELCQMPHPKYGKATRKAKARSVVATVNST